MDNLRAAHGVPNMFEKECGSQKQKILLFLDQCAAHARDASKLRNVHRVSFSQHISPVTNGARDNQVFET
jgi:hypothetical protein